MKSLAVALLLASCLTVGAAEPPTMPAEVTLTSGRVLRQVRVVRWEQNRVVLQHAGGVDPIAFTLFKVPAPADLPAIRAAMVAGIPPVTANLKTRPLAGEVSGTAKETGVFKFSGAKVRAYAKALWPDAVARERSSLPANFRAMATVQRNTAVANAWNDALRDLTATASATTDTDGGFTLNLPADQEVFLVCSAWRQIGKVPEQITWVVTPDPAAEKIDLDDSNQFTQPD